MTILALVVGAGTLVGLILAVLVAFVIAVLVRWCIAHLGSVPPRWQDIIAVVVFLLVFLILIDSPIVV